MKNKVMPTPQTCNAVPGKTKEIIMTPQWLPEKGEFPVCRAAYAPLMNGEHAFGSVAKAIEQAKKNIDIITWGFQASMYFERPGKYVGDLLKEATKRGVRVRVMVWFSPTGQIVDPNFPGWEAYFPAEQQQQNRRFMSPDEELAHYQQQRKNGVPLLATGMKLSYETDKQYEYDKDWHYQAAHGYIPGLEVRHRDFSWVADPSSVNARLKELSPPYEVKDDSSMARDALLKLYATHHQKMVLVDYEDPDLAVGFVMGHNMLSQYWDTDRHEWWKHHSPDSGRDGATAWQDFSSCVYGEVLWQLNDNFVESWERDVDDSTPKNERAGIQPDVFLPTPARLQALNTRLNLPVPLNPSIGQICRTQPQYKRYDILKAYMESVRRARKYIYIENQYFRFEELAEQIRDTVNMLIGCGRDPDKHGYLYLFVVTNSTEKPTNSAWPSNAVGGYQTYKMLDTLGRADLYPKYAKLDKNSTVAVKPQDIPGLRTLICALVSPDSPAGQQWYPTYVHSKLMLIDDIFLIQGSANINLRSMAFDSEIAIALQDTDQDPIIPTVRRNLWGLHSGNPEVGDDPKTVYDNWSTLIKDNKGYAKQMMMPKSSLIEFNDESAKLVNQD